MVPGVVILSRVATVLRTHFPHIELGALLNARFHAPLRPGETFCVDPQLRRDQVGFKVLLTDTGVLIASGQWQCQAVDNVTADKT